MFVLSSAVPGIVAYEKNGMKLDMTFEVVESVITINMLATNNSLAPMTDFLFQAAVPKVSDGLNSFFFYGKVKK